MRATLTDELAMARDTFTYGATAGALSNAPKSYRSRGHWITSESTPPCSASHGTNAITSRFEARSSDSLSLDPDRSPIAIRTATPDAPECPRPRQWRSSTTTCGQRWQKPVNPQRGSESLPIGAIVVLIAFAQRRSRVRWRWQGRLIGAQGRVEIGDARIDCSAVGWSAVARRPRPRCLSGGCCRWPMPGLLPWVCPSRYAGCRGNERVRWSGGSPRPLRGQAGADPEAVCAFRAGTVAHSIRALDWESDCR